MKVTVRISNSFKKALKPLSKKSPSLHKDLLRLESDLVNNPKLGTPLGHNTFKIRLKINDKHKGKSGGARIISLVEHTLIGEIDLTDEETTVNLPTIYDKAAIASITNQELKDLIKNFHLKK